MTNPSTGEQIRSVPMADAADIDAAVQSARRAFPAWRATPPLRRARILARFRELLEANQKAIATLISEEHGKVFLDAMGSVQRGIEVVEFATGAPHLLKGAFSDSVGRDVDAYSILQPVGVCAGITPFNFPAMVPLWMFPVALACGNTFILKPSEKDPSPSVLMAELLKEAGLPDGVFNVVHGDKEAVEAILAHPGIDAVSFVGSTPIARHIYTTAAAAGKRVQALGGAKNHAVVHARCRHRPSRRTRSSAPLTDRRANAAWRSRRWWRSAMPATVWSANLPTRAARLKVAPSLADGSDMGPVVTARTSRSASSATSMPASPQGATLVVDGRGLVIAGHERGFFVGPTLFDRVTPAMTIYRTRSSGRCWSSSARLARRSDHARQRTIPTATARRSSRGPARAARLFEHEVQVGMVGINVPIPVPMAFYSFGGWKESLFGDLHVHGTEGISSTRAPRP